MAGGEMMDRALMIGGPEDGQHVEALGYRRIVTPCVYRLMTVAIGEDLRPVYIPENWIIGTKLLRKIRERITSD